jgi:hypothetical protein
MTTKLLTLVNPKATLERCACRAVGLPCRLSLSFGAGDGCMDQPKEAFHLVHTIDPRLGERIGVAIC